MMGRASVNRSTARFDRDRFSRFDRRDRFARFDRDRFDRRRFRRFRNTAFLFDFWGDGYYDYAYACPIVTVRYVRGGRVFYRTVRQCDY